MEVRLMYWMMDIFVPGNNVGWLNWTMPSWEFTDTVIRIRGKEKNTENLILHEA